MKTITVRVPERLIAELEAESRLRKVPRSKVVRERLEGNGTGSRRQRKRPTVMELAGDLIGSVDGLPEDLSARKKHYLRVLGYGKNRRRR